MALSRASGRRAGSVAMLLAVVLVSIALLATSAQAFSDTAPLLAYTSRRSALLADKEEHAPLARRWLHTNTRGNSPAVYPADVARTVTRRGKQAICSLDGVAIVEVDSLPSHGFSMLPSSSQLQKRAIDAPAQLSFGHVSLNHGDAVREVKKELQRLCGNKSKGQLKSNDELVTIISAASLQDNDLDSKIESFMKQHPEHLVVVAPAARRMHFGKRQVGTLKKGDKGGSGGGDNSTSPVVDPHLGLFHRYQFFSSGLLVGILVFVIILIPAAYTSLSLLASIQTPDKLGNTDKSRPGQDKKSQ